MLRKYDNKSKKDYENANLLTDILSEMGLNMSREEIFIAIIDGIVSKERSFSDYEIALILWDALSMNRGGYDYLSQSDNKWVESAQNVWKEKVGDNHV